MRRLSLQPRIFGRDLADVIKRAHQPKRAALQKGRAMCILHARAFNRRQPKDRTLRSCLAPDSREAFLSCWLHPPKMVKEIKAHVRASLPEDHQARCPYCQLPYLPSTFDHVVERARLPELAFYHRNLVPSCWDCNTQRETSFDAFGVQRVLHLHDDEVEGIPDVLRATIEIAERRVTARFSLQDPLPPAAELYGRHFSALFLADRYQTWAADKMLELSDDLLADGSSVSDWPTILLNRAARAIMRWGTNDPGVALKRALASHPLALDLLATP